ncbi:MAG: hypothetical protein ACK45H_01025 [Bacteroidota bacterium]
MNKTISSVAIFFVLMAFCDAHAQSIAGNETKIQVLENGVVIHESVGVEGIVVVSTETPVQVNASDNWTVQQIREVIEYIKVKKLENCSAKELQDYDEQLSKLEIRLKELESNN